MKFVPLAAVIAIHDRQISRHGGAAGLRDRALLEAGCDRARNRAAHDPAATLFDIAAAYAFGLAKAHGFTDGNKRTAFVTALTFLRLNGYEVRIDPIDGVQTMAALAAGDVSEAQFAHWLDQRATPLTA